MKSILEFENISRSYKKDVPVLKGVTFSMNEGEVAGLVGRNGSGQDYSAAHRDGHALSGGRACARLRALPYR